MMPKPRLCHLKKVPDFTGYGFNLQAKPGRDSQFIGRVDPNSPADRADLRSGDRVIEVNGTNVEHMGHNDVVGQIKTQPDEVLLLVVDQDTDDYYRERNIPITKLLLAEQIAERVVDAVERAAERRGSDDSSRRASSEHVVAQVNIVGHNENEQHENGTSAQPTETAPKPRLCVLRKMPTFAGYGFNLQMKPGVGQVIGKVDPDSPAEIAGLLPSDRLVSVNGTNVENETHAETVTLIKQRPNEVAMLVVDAATDAYYRERNIPICIALLGDRDDAEPHEAIETREAIEKIEAAAESASVHSRHSSDHRVIAAAVAAAVVHEAVKSIAPKPRLCTIVRVPTFSGYGFNLHSEKGRQGQFVGKVDPGSPAETAGLRQDDMLIEVNGSNVEAETHAQVVTRIREQPNQVTMLVVDRVTEAYYRDRNIPITCARAMTDDDQTDAVVGNGVRNGNGTAVIEVVGKAEATRVETAPTPGPTASKVESRPPPVYTEPTRAAATPSSGKSSDILSVTPAQVRERLQQNNARVRVKQSDKSFKDRSAAFDML